MVKGDNSMNESQALWTTSSSLIKQIHDLDDAIQKPLRIQYVAHHSSSVSVMLYKKDAKSSNMSRDVHRSKAEDVKGLRRASACVVYPNAAETDEKDFWRKMPPTLNER
jgi:hypothetical protein